MYFLYVNFGINIFRKTQLLTNLYYSSVSFVLYVYIFSLCALPTKLNFVFSIFSFINFLLEDSCFIILHLFPPYITMNQLQVYICPLPPEPLSCLPPHSTPLVVTEHWVKLPVSHSKSPLAICFTYGMYMFPCYSLSWSPSPFPLLCPQVCSLCLYLHCCPINRFISTIFLDSIYMH